MFEKNIRALETENLLLKELDISDVTENYVTWLNDEDINQFLQVRHQKHTLKTTRDYVQNLKESEHNFLFGIFEKNNNRHIGNIRLTISHPIDKVANIGILIGEKNSHGKGYAKESILKVTEFGFKKLNLKRIEAGFYENNDSGINSFLKCGYEIDGILKSYWIHNNKRVARILASVLNDKS